MTTELLYYMDPYIKSFKALVLKQAVDGERSYVVLDKSAFYPTGGGQPSDIGTLNDVSVTGVEKIDNEVRHYVETALTEHTNVVGEIDWEKRFDHMQQHCGQHILSAAFEEQFDFETVGFHLGTEIVTIDLKTDELSQEILDQVERRANEVIIANLPIEVKWVTQEDLDNYPMRKKPKVTENIRLVIIPEFDYNGCGGTHPRSTAEVGLIKIFGWEKNRGNTRLQFACGFRALKVLHFKQMTLSNVASQLRTSELEVSVKLDQVLEAQLEQSKELDIAKERLLDYEAHKIASNFKYLGTYKLIGCPYSGRSIKELQLLARKITEAEEESIILLVTEIEDRLQMVFATGKNVKMKMNDLLNTALEMIDGKGGGKTDFAQGGGSAKITAVEMVTRISSILENQI